MIFSENRNRDPRDAAVWYVLAGILLYWTSHQTPSGLLAQPLSHTIDALSGPAGVAILPIIA